MKTMVVRWPGLLGFLILDAMLSEMPMGKTEMGKKNHLFLSLLGPVPLPLTPATKSAQVKMFSFVTF